MVLQRKTKIQPDEKIMNKIIVLRGEKVMLDVHLAEIYEVETRSLKQSVRRNLDLFPKDFMFLLTQKEVDLILAQNIITSKQQLGGSKPYAFTETGVAMLSSVLKSMKAKEINITIMRTFVALRNMMMSNAELRLELEMIKKKINKHDKNIELVFQYIDKLLEVKRETKPLTQIGYKITKK